VRTRIVGLALGCVALFSILLTHFFFIQVIDGDYWSARADRQHYFSVHEPFIRGSIFSNSAIKKGHPESKVRFVFDVQKFHLHIDPLSLPEENRQEMIKALLARLEVPPETLISFYEQFEKRSRNRLLKMWIDPKTREEILAWWRDYAKAHAIPQNALFFVSDYQRSYPFGKMLGQVLHTVQSRRDEKTRQATPTGGLELTFNSYLQGKLGKRKLMRSPRHTMALGEIEEVPENGADLHLTINHYLQAIAEEELAKGVAKSEAKGGWAVMMDPWTGAILACAQVPFFDLTHYQDYFNNPEKMDHTRLHALVDVFEPGSVMKPFTVMATLMANQEAGRLLVDPEEKIRCDDGNLPGRRQPMKDEGSHTYLNMNMAIQKSANIYMAKAIDRVVEALGHEWYRNVLTDRFGFGEKTRLEYPGENPGRIPRPGKLHPNGKLEWSVPTPYSLAIGYNLEVNSIQLLRAWALIANGGYRVDPTFIRKITKEDRVLVDHTTRGVGERVIDPAIVARVREALRYSTMTGGTCRRANIPGFTEIGKSGTSRKIVDGTYSRKKHRASFVGFAPVEKPRFVLIVTLDEPKVRYIPGTGPNHHGGVCAAPIFREIAKKTLEYMGVSPDDPYGYPKGDPRHDPDLAIWGKETRRLLEKYHSWNK